MGIAATAAFLCMTLVIHEEARGEPITVKQEVGQVVMNRIESRHYPDTCEAVVLQPKQFEWTRKRGIKDEYDLKQRYFRLVDSLDTPQKRRAFSDSQRAAELVLTGKFHSRLGKALHFVTTGHRTVWTKTYTRYRMHGIDFLLKRKT